MSRIIKCLVAIVFLVTLVGCQPSEADKMKTYSEEVTKLVTDNGYTVEELTALQHGQHVDKVYNNEVLERFGKIMVYEYLVQSKYTDSISITNHDTGEKKEKDFVISNDEMETSVLAPDEFQEFTFNNYSDAAEKPTITNTGYFIADAFYEADDYTKRGYYCINPSDNSSSYAVVGNNAPVYMEVDKLKEILSVSSNENKWYRLVTEHSIVGKQLIFPLSK